VRNRRATIPPATAQPSPIGRKTNGWKRLQDYLKRGRKLAGVPLEELRTRWMALIREWAENTSSFDHNEEQDIRSEMAARKIEPPFDLVRDALNAIKAKAKEHWAEVLQHNPFRALQFELDLRQSIERFETDSRRRTS
jgi:hypothetical protein